MKNNWKEMPLPHQVIFSLSCTISLIVVVIALLSLTGGVPETAIVFCLPLMGIVELCQTYTQWKTNRLIAYFSLGMAIFLCLGSIIIFIS